MLPVWKEKKNHLQAKLCCHACHVLAAQCLWVLRLAVSYTIDVGKKYICRCQMKAKFIPELG